MDKKLRRLETFAARGSDGQTYAVHGYEHLGRVDAFINAQEHWEPLGVAEYKLADGRHVDFAHDGTMTVAGTELTLRRAH